MSSTRPTNIHMDFDSKLSFDEGNILEDPE